MIIDNIFNLFFNLKLKFFKIKRGNKPRCRKWKKTER